MPASRKAKNVNSKSQRCQSKKNTAQEGGSLDVGREEVAGEDGDKKPGLDVYIDWSKDGCCDTWCLLSEITNDRSIKNGLFPPPGSYESTSNGGGNSKTDWHWKLIVALFRDHEEYSAHFKAALELNEPGQGKQIDIKAASKACKPWVDKIKNHIRKMREITLRHAKEMGETGTGLTSDEQILSNSPLYTKWAAIKQTTPWFFEMNTLIAEHPNSKPVGLRNSGTDVDLSVVDKASDTREGSVDWHFPIDINAMTDEAPYSSEHPSKPAISDVMSTALDTDEDDHDVNAEKVNMIESRKCKLEEDSQTTFTSTKTPACPGSSKPTPPPVPQAVHSKKKYSRDLLMIAQIEAATHEKELDVKVKMIKIRKEAAA